MSILDEVPGEAKCRSLIRRALFGRRPYCPHCLRSGVRRCEGRWRCPGCRRKFSLTSATWMRRCRLPVRRAWLLLLLWQRATPFGVAVSVSGVSAPTVRRWFRLFRSNFAQESPEMGPVVEVDEAFLGRRRHGRQRIVLGMLDRRTGRVALRPVRRRGYEQTDDFILDHAMGGSTVCTDSAQCYVGIKGFFGYRHVACNHSKFVFGPTNRIEATWSRLKRFLRRTVGRPTASDLPETLREFEARINHPEMFESPLTFLEFFLNPVPSACF
jgi:transposase-like protein